MTWYLSAYHSRTVVQSQYTLQSSEVEMLPVLSSIYLINLGGDRRVQITSMQIATNLITYAAYLFQGGRPPWGPSWGGPRPQLALV